MSILSAAYSEIMLKGKNRGSFEALLIRNIAAGLQPFGKFKVKKASGKLIISSESDADWDSAKLAVLRTFGIDIVSLCHSANADIEDIQKAVLSHSASLTGHSIRVDTKRADKRFPMNSQKVNETIGKALVDAGCTVDLETPERTIYIDIQPSQALVSFERLKGFGGLPVGSSGKAISLLSGGIDSPVASWMLMKRGCSVDFLHVSAKKEDAKSSKITRLAGTLRTYSPVKMKLFLASYDEFYKKSISMKPANELVVFRRFLFHLTNSLAEKHGYMGVITGDSIGQVASQTIENVFASDEAAKIPVFRPLVGFNKQEIVDLAMKIGTYNASIEEYKDCCSLVATTHPSTKVPLDAAKKIEEEIGIDAIVEKTLADMEIIEI